MILCNRSYPSLQYGFSDQYSPSPYSLMFHAMHVIAALWRNADTLRTSCAAMSVTTLEPDVIPPPSLSPTILQLTIPHLPLIDVLPFPFMRDRILQSQAIFDMDDFRRDILNQGVRCWGRNPWNERGWEFPKEFVEKWWFLLDQGMVDGTNFWRSEREEELLSWKGTRTSASSQIFEID